MGQLAERTCHLCIDVQRPSSESVIEDLSPGPIVGYHRNNSCFRHKCQSGSPEHGEQSMLHRCPRREILR